jgi:hypothetical protein
MKNYRKGCLVSILVLCAILAILLYNTRSLTIERGVRLSSFTSGNFTYDAWSYGTWRESRQGKVYVSTYSPPYTLVLAIRSNTSSIKTIEIIEVSIIDKGGNRGSLISFLSSRKDKIQVRKAAAISDPYAVFVFNDALHSYDTVTIEIEFISHFNGKSEATRQLITISGYEKRDSGFTFWNALMGI